MEHRKSCQPYISLFDKAECNYNIFADSIVMDFDAASLIAFYNQITYFFACFCTVSGTVRTAGHQKFDSIM